MKETLEKLTVLANDLDGRGLDKVASVIDEIVKEAARKMTSDNEDESGYLSSAVASFRDKFDVFARRVDGGTARKAMASAEVKKNKVYACLDRLEGCIDELEGYFKTC